MAGSGDIEGPGWETDLIYDILLHSANPPRTGPGATLTLKRKVLYLNMRYSREIAKLVIWAADKLSNCRKMVFSSFKGLSFIKIFYIKNVGV